MHDRSYAAAKNERGTYMPSGPIGQKARDPKEDDDFEGWKTKAELQRRMEEARESISQCVTEIKDTVATQYQQARESVSPELDWREHYRRHPVVWSVGALSVGFILGLLSRRSRD